MSAFHQLSQYVHRQGGCPRVTSSRGNDGGSAVKLDDACCAGRGSVLVEGDLLAGLRLDCAFAIPGTGLLPTARQKA